MLDWLASLTLLERILLYIAAPATLLLLLQTLLLLIGLGGGDDGADSAHGGGHGLMIDLNGDGIPDVHADFHGLDFHPDLHADIHADLHAGFHDGGHPCDSCGEIHGPEAHGEHPHHGDGTAGGLHVFTLRGLVTFFTLFGWSGLLFCQLELHWLLALFFAVQVGVIGMVAVAILLREALRLQSDGTLDIRNALGLPGTVYLTVPAARRETGKVNVTVQDQLREFEAVTDSESPILTGAEVRVVGVTGGDTLIVEPIT